jgi:hypothetical protein
MNTGTILARDSNSGQATSHICSAGNMPGGTQASLAATKPLVVLQPNWYKRDSAGTAAVTTLFTSPAVLGSLKPWGIPCYPSSSGWCSPYEGTTQTTPVGANNDPQAYAPGEPGFPRKYQYWAIKLKPYFETQFSVQNRIYMDQMFQLDLNVEVTNFKSFAWAEASIWYQYDSSNPIINGEEINYRNYFFCFGAGVTVKPILMTISLSLKLRNCYKVLI